MSFDFLAWWVSFSEAPFVLLIILLIITHFIYLRYFRHARLTVISPSLIMALGSFIMICLPELQVPISFMVIVAEELLLVWVYITIALLYGYSQDSISFSRPIHKLEMGAWITGTAITMLVIDQIEPTLFGFILMLGFASFLLYAIYCGLMVQWMRAALNKKVTVDGRLMLMTIATLSLALLMMEVFGFDVPSKIYQIIILIGMIMGLLSFLAISVRLFRQCNRHFLAVWSVSNCLIYGAFAMAGLAALETHAFSSQLIFINWCWVVSCFIVIEGLELIRLIIKWQTQGLIKAVGKYHVLQWLRIFSLVMMHGFALSYYNHHYISSELLAFLANYMQYLVAVLVVIELGLFGSRVVKHGEYR